jgi:uncharacterized cofD-like protein
MKVVAIGGGGGAQQVLRGMLAYGADLAAVIAVTDTGRSTGVARALVDMPAPGDLRSTIAALALDPANQLAGLLDYRLSTSAIPALDGMAVGNLLLAALTQRLGDFALAVEALQRLAGCAAQVLPVSTANTQLCAQLADGTRVEGELAVRGLAKPPIRQLFLREPAPAFGPALAAIAAADLVVIGPGSLYTTLLATLLFEGMAEALASTPATVVYVANTTAQPGQTDGLSLADHVAALVELLGPGVLDVVLLNSAPPPAHAAALAAAGVHPLHAGDDACAAIAALGPRVVLRPLAEHAVPARQLWNKVDTIRHHPARLGAALYDIIVREV